MALFPFSFMQSQSQPLLLDLYPGAAAAYSVRKLRNAYAGSAIRVRRSSDNTEQDIGFSGGNLDTTALTSFCSGTNGFVTTWYDQSGNGYNATQTTAASQPQIVSSGSVLTLTGIGSARPILSFDGTNDYFTFTPITLDQFTSFYPNKKNSTSDISMWMATGTGIGNPYTPVIYQSFGVYIQNQSGDQYRNLSYNNANYILISGGYNSSSVGSIQINNSNISLTLSNVGSLNTTISQIGRRQPTEYSFAKVPEIILYTFDNSSNISSINTNINTYYGIY
jgi:3D (Asp-Asp-Asp) domain-containing protein